MQKTDDNPQVPPSKVPAVDATQEQESEGLTFDPMALNDEQIQLVDNELNCQYYFNKLGIQKRKIKKTYKKWKFYHKKSVYHNDPFPKVFNDE